MTLHHRQTGRQIDRQIDRWVPRQHGGAHRSSPPAGGDGGCGHGLVGIARHAARARPGSAVLGRNHIFVVALGQRRSRRDGSAGQTPRPRWAHKYLPGPPRVDGAARRQRGRGRGRRRAGRA